MIGDYQCKLDAKGRLMFPADFQEQLGSLSAEGFVLRPGLYHKCIEMYTLHEWMLKQEELKLLSPFIKSNIDMIRKYNSGARQVKLDSTGRLLIPKPLLEQSGLEKEVVIIALPNYLEIWDKDRYQAVNNEMDAETMRRLMEEKFGNK